MKTAKPPAPESSAGSNRRAQPVRQTRINPPRTSSLNRNNSLASEPAPQQPIDIFPAITHFADAITALPKELVRHFTLLKEVDAKIFTPEAALFQFVEQALNIPTPEPARSFNDGASSIAAASTPVSAHGSSTGAANANHPTAPSVSDSANAAIYDSVNLPRRHLFRQAAYKMQEMLVSLEEKNHVISTANEALQKQMARIEEIWPHLESEFSEEAKWGSDTHWAYVENRPSKATQAQAERSRREGAATLSAAAQQLAEEAAARSSDRKQALAAKKNSKVQAQAQAPDAESDGKPQETGKKGPGTGKSRKPPADPAAVGLGITNPPTSNGATAPKRRAKGTTTASGGAMSTVFGTAATKPKTTSPRETPAPETNSKKRKALPTSSGQVKKSRTAAAMSPSVASSPLLANFPDVARIGRNSPVPLPPQPRPASARARKNSTSTQPNGDASRTRPTSAASNNKQPNGVAISTPSVDQQSNGAKTGPETTTQKETVVTPLVPSASSETVSKPETEIPPPIPEPSSTANGTPVTNNSVNNKKEASVKVEEREPIRKETPTLPPPTPTTTVTTTKSGRASKPSTPALATFAEAAGASAMSRSRSSRNTESAAGNGNTGAATGPSTATKRSHKKGASLSAAAAAAAAAVANTTSQLQSTPSSHDKEGGKHTKDKEKDKDVRENSIVENANPRTTSRGVDGNPRSGPGTSNAGGNSIGPGGVSGPGGGLPGALAGTRHFNSSAAGAGTTTEDDDDDADMDEQRYCLCNGVSYGEMVACDGVGCPREWFHLGCVGLKVAPKGNTKWYCEDCKKGLRTSERR